MLLLASCMCSGYRKYFRSRGDRIRQENAFLMLVITINILLYKPEVKLYTNIHEMLRPEEDRFQQKINAVLRKFKANITHSHFYAEPSKYLFYFKAKKAEVSRKLIHAIELYELAAERGERVESCIKDIASVVHQLGYTPAAIQFLEEMRNRFPISNQSYQKLINNLKSQLKPSGKHEFTKILLDLKNLRREEIPTETSFLRKLFKTPTRIKKYILYNELGFQQENYEGKYFVLEFDSFSAAKKTMDKFNDCQWFEIDRYWMNKNSEIVCHYCDGRSQFHNHRELALKATEAYCRGHLNFLILENEELLEQLKAYVPLRNYNETILRLLSKTPGKIKFTDLD